MSELTDAIIQRAISEAKAGNKEAAKKSLSEVVRREPNNARAWYLLSQLTTTDKETIYCLERVLRIHPDNEKIKSRLSQVLSSEQAKSVLSGQHDEQIKPQSTDKLQFPKSDSVISEANPPPVTKPLTKKCPYCAEIIRADAIVCRFCNRRLVPPGRIASFAPSSQKKKSNKFLGFITITAILFICVCGLASISILGNIGNNSRVKSGGRLHIGDVGKLASGGNNIFIPTDLDAFDKVVHAAVIKDNYAIAELAAQGRVFIVPAGTKVRVIDSSITATQVRILNGEYTGLSGWVPSEWVIP